jgi:hypothetical protein
LIREDEVAAAKSLGLAVYQKGSELRFDLPCRHVRGTVCTVYDRRLSPCREFQCRLLKDYLAGVVDMRDATRKILRAKEMIAEVQELAPPGQSLAQARDESSISAEAFAALPAEVRQTRGLLRLKITQLYLFLDHHFRLNRETEMVVRD